MDPIIDWQISRHDVRSRGTYLLETGEKSQKFLLNFCIVIFCYSREMERLQFSRWQ